MEEFRFTFDPEKLKKKKSETAETDIKESGENISFDSPEKEPKIHPIDFAAEKKHSESYDSYLNNLKETINVPEAEFDEEDLAEEGYEDWDGINDLIQSEELSEDEARQLRMRIKAEKRLEHKKAAAEKKLLKEERKKHRGNYLLFYIAFGLIFVILAVSLSLTVFFNINEIEVEGCVRYTSDDVAAASGITLGDNMFLTSYSDCESEICLNLPYVRSASFKRHINGKITITVQETYEYMVVSCEDGFAILSPEKKVLRISEGSYPKNLVHVFGLQASEAKIGETAVFKNETVEKLTDSLIQELISAGFTRITDIDVSNTSAVKVVYDKRIQMNLGTSDDFEYKLSFARKAIDTTIDSDAVGVLNLGQLSSTNREVQFRETGFYSVTR